MFVDTFTATIYCGLREGYNGVVHTVEEAEYLLQQFCDKWGLGLTLTKTQFIYTNGREPGIIVGLINYPRFPKSEDAISDTAKSIAGLLKDAFKQERVTIVFPNWTLTIGEL